MIELVKFIEYLWDTDKISYGGYLTLMESVEDSTIPIGGRVESLWDYSMRAYAYDCISYQTTIEIEEFVENWEMNNA